MERGGRDLKGVSVGEHDGSARPSRPKAERANRKGRENAAAEIHETQSGTHVPGLVERLARMDPAELARLLEAVRPAPALRDGRRLRSPSVPAFQRNQFATNTTRASGAIAGAVQRANAPTASSKRIGVGSSPGGIGARFTG